MDIQIEAVQGLRSTYARTKRPREESSSLPREAQPKGFKIIPAETYQIVTLPQLQGAIRLAEQSNVRNKGTPVTETETQTDAVPKLPPSADNLLDLDDMVNVADQRGRSLVGGASAVEPSTLKRPLASGASAARPPKIIHTPKSGTGAVMYSFRQRFPVAYETPRAPGPTTFWRRQKDNPVPGPNHNYQGQPQPFQLPNVGPRPLIPPGQNQLTLAQMGRGKIPSNTSSKGKLNQPGDKNIIPAKSPLLKNKEETGSTVPKPSGEKLPAGLEPEQISSIEKPKGRV